MKAWPYLLVFLIPLTVILGFWFGGWYTFITPIVVFGIVPIIDALIGQDESNLSIEKEKELENKRTFRIITQIAAPFNTILVILGAYWISTIQLSAIELIVFTISMGISSGVFGINISHELGHRIQNRFEPFLSRLILISTLYMHWILEHVVGHHRNVATFEDPATARLNESVYRFLPRSIFGAIGSIWTFEKNRLQRMNKSFISIENRIIAYFLLEAVFTFGIFYFFGILAILYFLIQSFIAILLLETINYIEHYGLLRNKIGDKAEPVQPIHSWNSNYWLTNHFLFNLQRHSDHHYQAHRCYQILRYHENSLQLPAGYATMVLLALIPPLWKKIINPRIPESIIQLQLINTKNIIRNNM